MYFKKAKSPIAKDISKEKWKNCADKMKIFVI